MRISQFALLGTPILSVLFFSPLGRAQPGPTAALSCRDDSECARLLDLGKESSKEGRLEEARRFYEQAYQRRADSQLLFNLARVLHRAGHPADAVPYYQKYLDAGADADETQKHKAIEYLEQARREMAPPPPQPPPPSAQPLPVTSPPPLSVAALAPTEVHHGTPVYRKWWLWTAVGGAVAGIAVGVGLGVAARRPDVTDAAAVRPFAN
jgi:tetratricopeptide (TPR) repeat protein